MQYLEERPDPLMIDLPEIAAYEPQKDLQAPTTDLHALDET